MKKFVIEYKLEYTMFQDIEANTEEEALKIASENPHNGEEGDVDDYGYIAYEVMEEADEEVHSNGN
jgi:hypothetical protein